ncbi:hypothetical protein PZN02_005369 [Sinorhizobium garamanticum]|uniref:GST N-terminal domain-containing protein n=1 Tax=Sinorhizobium garamanticum TaxID=680247 RepID=A0ABY8DM44_9HYPH|nr:hypothetical protein [Sinorhizobium garamanticum]WEX90026.1 hypothetical protein PZN02_005369 [Sinorhizobium garamanticum]
MVPSRDDLDSLRLYVSYACPFAHRVLVGMALRGVMGRLRLSVVQPVMGPDGWVLHPSDTEPGVSTLLDVYRRARPGFSRRASVPMLYSVTEKRILSDDSLEILSWIDRLPGNSREGSLFPAQLEPELDRLGKFVADAINSGVYEAGFAPNQEAYDQAVTKLFFRIGPVGGTSPITALAVGRRLDRR